MDDWCGDFWLEKRQVLCVIWKREEKKKKKDPFIPAFVLKQKLSQLPGSKKHFQIERKKKKVKFPYLRDITEMLNLKWKKKLQKQEPKHKKKTRN